MKNVLVVHYSQSGQLSDVVRNFTRALEAADFISVRYEFVSPENDYPFPWPFWRFFDTFPEAVYLDPPAIKPLTLDGSETFDLIIIAYQVWFLSPSLPITAFLKNPVAQKLLRGTPVVTLIACRNMWLQAQEVVKGLISEAGGSLVGNVALVDEAGAAASFLSTPLWVLTGYKGPWLGGLIPRAGVSPREIAACQRFGERIRDVFIRGEPLDESLLRGLSAVKVNEKLIASEKVGRRSFKLWGGLLRLLGPQGSIQRKPVLLVYILFLVTLILTFVPISILVKTLLSPLSKKHREKQRGYYAMPSGD